MIYIAKGQEPKVLTEYKKKSNAYFDGCPKDAIRESLLAEQGCLCAYCMRRINKRNMRIEHWYPESRLSEYEKLDYSNMLGVCYGHLEGTQGKDDTCDAQKGNQCIKVNPLDKTTLNDIEYCSATGEISSFDKEIDNDLQNTLNLNSKKHFLPENRKVKLDSVIRLLKLRFGDKAWTADQLQRFLEQYSKNNINGEKPEYLGIINWYINKQIKRRK